MSKNNITTGMRLQNRQIYEEALKSGLWICYKQKWYTPSEFATRLGSQELHIAHITLKDPREVLRLGRKAFEQRIINGESTDRLLDGLHRLNEFTNKFWLQCRPDMFDIERRNL